jgi:hypothetical protein
VPGAPSSLDCRRALEALRSGVPNRDAVRVLGAHQPEAEAQFTKQLGGVATGKTDGLLVAGGFGTGKSHLLQYFEHLALTANCVVSRIVISKETPIYDGVKVFRAAVESAVVPGRRGHAIQEIAHMLRPNSERYARFYQWANAGDSNLAQLFPATLFLHERLNSDPELVEEVTNFWSGERIGVARVRQGLKQLNASRMFAVEAVPLKKLSLQWFAFGARLIEAAGFKGWVLLFDEVELIGRYTPLQRGRSYTEVARWMRRLGDVDVGPIAPVLAITDDFALAVIQGKSDREVIAERLSRKEPEASVAMATEGMRLLERDALLLNAPDDDLLARTYEQLRAIHATGYNWQPPALGAISRTVQRPMRAYVRRWINEWDLRRLYPEAVVDLHEESVSVNYETDADLEVETEVS